MTGLCRATKPCLRRFGHEHEILALEAVDGHDGHVRRRVVAPDDPRADVLIAPGVSADDVRSALFTSTDCVASSARGAMNVIGFGGDDHARRHRAAPRMSPDAGFRARSSGTLTYASSPSPDRSW